MAPEVQFHFGYHLHLGSVRAVSSQGECVVKVPWGILRFRGWSVVLDGKPDDHLCGTFVSDSAFGHGIQETSVSDEDDVGWNDWLGVISSSSSSRQRAGR